MISSLIMSFLSMIQEYLGFSSLADSDAGRYIAAILNVYNALSRLPSLAPSPEVNSLFSELVALCIQTPDEVVTATVRCPSAVGCHLHRLIKPE